MTNTTTTEEASNGSRQPRGGRPLSRRTIGEEQVAAQLWAPRARKARRVDNHNATTTEEDEAVITFLARSNAEDPFVGATDSNPAPDRRRNRFRQGHAR